jgi:hypothetical protein
MALLQLSELQVKVLKGLQKSEQLFNPEMAALAETLLLASKLGDAATVAAQTKQEATGVTNLLDAWEAKKAVLAVAEKRGEAALREQVQQLLDSSEAGGDDDCCDCDEDQDEDGEPITGLNQLEIEVLAYKVYHLMRHELKIERERIGFHAYG